MQIINPEITKNLQWPDSIKKNEDFFGFSDEGGFVCFRG